MHRLTGFRPQDLLNVMVVGVGGTGSQLISVLVQLHQALLQLGGAGLNVQAFDPGVVSLSNTVRQRYAASDIGASKAITLITRVNYSVGTSWQAHPRILTAADLTREVHVLFSCVDTRQARREIAGLLRSARVHYWIDCGNEAHTGQVLLGQPGCRLSRSRAQPRLKTPAETHRKHLGGNDDDVASCSALESLGRQDLLVNTRVATEAADLLWQLLRYGQTRRVGSYLNLKDGLTVAVPAPVPHPDRRFRSAQPPALIRDPA